MPHVNLVKNTLIVKNKIGKKVVFNINRESAIETMLKYFDDYDLNKLTEEKQYEYLFFFLQEIARETIKLSINNTVSDVHTKISAIFDFDINDPENGIMLMSFDKAESIKEVCINAPFTIGNEFSNKGEQ